MNGLKWLCAGVLVVVTLAVVWPWPTCAQTNVGGEPKLVDRMGPIDQRLERMEKALLKIQDQLKDLRQPKATWQKISEAKDSSGWIIFMDTNTGKVRWVSISTPGNLLEK